MPKTKSTDFSEVTESCEDREAAGHIALYPLRQQFSKWGLAGSVSITRSFVTNGNLGCHPRAVECDTLGMALGDLGFNKSSRYF